MRVETADPAAARLAFTLVHSLGADAQIASFRGPVRAPEPCRSPVEGGHGLQLLHEIGVLSAALEPCRTSAADRRAPMLPRAATCAAALSPPAPCRPTVGRAPRGAGP